MTNKEQYKYLCEREQSIPLRSQHWWMDAVCPDSSWDVILSRQQGYIVAAMPYQLITRFGFNYIIQPMFTLANGIWIKYPNNQNEYKRITFEKEICTDIINQLERLKLSFFSQNFNYAFTNWLPFYWKGFTQTTRYSYIIQDISNPEKLFLQFYRSKQKQIKKAQRNQLKISMDMPPEEFYKHHRRTLAQKGAAIYYNESSFLSLYQAASQRKQGQIIAIKNDTETILACLFTAWDANSGFDLICSIDKNYAASGASTLIIWETLRYLSDKTRQLDMEGSMIEDVEFSFRQFATTQTPYFQIEKEYSTIFKILFSFKQKLKRK